MTKQDAINKVIKQQLTKYRAERDQYDSWLNDITSQDSSYQFYTRQREAAFAKICVLGDLLSKIETINELFEETIKDKSPRVDFFD